MELYSHLPLINNNELSKLNLIKINLKKKCINNGCLN